MLLGARDWDMMAGSDEQFYAAEYLELLRPALAGAPGRRVLDLGCGQGRIAIPLAREGYRVTAVDWSDDVLAAARRYAGDGPGPEFHRADILVWLRKEPDSAYDAVLVLEVLYMLEGWREALSESARVFAPGGVATEVVRHLEGAGFRDVRCTAIGLLPGKRSCRGRARRAPVLLDAALGPTAARPRPDPGRDDPEPRGGDASQEACRRASRPGGGMSDWTSRTVGVRLIER